MKTFHPSRHQATLTILLGGALLLITAIGAQIVLHGISERYSAMVDTRFVTLNELNQVNTLFKTQVQEWKNTLLRGKNSTMREKYWQSFQTAEAAVDSILKNLEQKTLTADSKVALKRFKRSHQDLAKRYLQGYQIYLNSQFDFAAVDNMLRGIDREPFAQLEDFTQRLEHEINAEADALKITADRYFMATLIIVGLASVIGAIGVAAIVRSAIDVEIDARGRSSFLAKMSHEIRTPMNGILGMSELLSSTALNEQQLRYNQAIHSSGQSLLILINDLLDYSRIEAGKMSLESIPYSLRGVLSNLFYLFTLKASEKQLIWHIDIAPDLPDQFIGDPVRLNQILVNLVGNGLKFTKQGGVTLKVSWDKQQLGFCCSDTGIGISQEAIKQLFTPFTQADNSISHRFGGTGLGLTISRELALQMRGEITVTSEQDKGSIFHLTIPALHGIEENEIHFPSPKAQIQLFIDNDIQASDYERHALYWGLTCKRLDPQQPIPKFGPEVGATMISIIDLANHNQSDQLSLQCRALGHKVLQLYDVGQSNEWITSHGELSQGFKDRPPFGALLKPLLLECLNLNWGKEASAYTHKGIRPLNILAADDNSVNRTVVSAMLAKLGHKCSLACDGEDAVSQFINNTRRFDLVLMDCEMPVLDGLGALKCIREIEAQQQSTPTPVLALTANAYQSDLDRYLDAGMDDVLTKPISLNSLKAALAKHAL